jgi:hypothetical protein
MMIRRKASLREVVMGMGKVQGNRAPAETKKPTFEGISRMSSVDRPEDSAKAEAAEGVDRNAAKKLITKEFKPTMGMAKFFAKKAPVRLSEGKPIKGNSLRAQALANSNDPEALARALIESMA